MFGWMGRMAVVDLSTRECGYRDLSEETLRDYLGGRGLGMRLLAERAAADPLSPDNPLIFCAGPLTGTGLPAVSRFSLTTRSPLTGTAFDANSGGTWGVRLKRCGVDALLVQGRASEPVYLAFDSDSGTWRIKPAVSLWGCGVNETTRRLLAAEGKKASIACIGPAGETGSLLAAVMNDRARTCARGGAGAVMGAKNLKAIVAAGNEPVGVADGTRLAYVKAEAQKWLLANPVTAAGLPQFGTAVLVNLLNELGSFPAYNFRTSRFVGADAISGESLTERFLVKRKACYGCPIACGRATRTSAGEGEGPEYESIWALGASCGIGDLEAIIRANHLCNDLGMDTISAGSTIACAMELTDTGALASGPRFGDTDALLGLLQDMATGRGLGKDLAAGSRRFASGLGAGHLAMQVKGLELPGYDPRGLQGQALAFATSNRGGCHLRAYMVGPEILGIPKLIDRFSVSDKPGMVIFNQNLNAAVDSLLLCRFVQFALSDEYFARMLEAVTGVAFAARDLHRIGERIWNLERLYNLRAGIDTASDTLPPRLLEEPVPEGPAAGQVARIPEMLPLYYRARGWDEGGVPVPHKLDQLGLPARIPE